MYAFIALLLNKRKIFNDPVYGFISIPHELIFDLIEHPYFQRLRNIKQLGLTHLVYPGALHTRFHHALGAMHLMGQALEVIRSKGTPISEEEAEAATISILLHDIGHGPFSHALEHCLIRDISHEDISAHMMEQLNTQFKGRLSLAIEIFNDRYPKKFLHQLVSGQLDMDRMDYLNRDSFYTGVSEGIIGFDRILKMLTVLDDELVVEEKGVYSIEKFLIARRLMYWQVYYHKTVIAAEQLLIKILQRAKELAETGAELFASPAFATFLYQQVSKENFTEKPAYLEAFVALDDSDIHSAIKVWREHYDPILSELCRRLISRDLYHIEIRRTAFTAQELTQKRVEMNAMGEAGNYFVFSGEIGNNTYSSETGKIHLLMKDRGKMDVAAVSDNLDLEALSRTIKKYFLCSSR